MVSETQIENPWSIVLAGGNGERLRTMVQSWLGRHKPKQYCTFIGSRSMFQHTLDRADQISLPDHRVTIVSGNHREEGLAQLRGRKKGVLVFQPADRSTAPGVFLALSHVRVKEPQATIVLFPSDHFIYPESEFIKVISSAVKATRQLNGRPVLLGVHPERSDPDYGWIMPGPHIGWIDGHRVNRVTQFIEKPELKWCEGAIAAGGLWNTMILVAGADVLWEMGWRRLPELMPLFDTYVETIGTRKEVEVLSKIYETLPSWNFSSDLLEHHPNDISVLELKNATWCDWGKPERILETLQRIGKPAAFYTTHSTGLGCK